MRIGSLFLLTCGLLLAPEVRRSNGSAMPEPVPGNIADGMYMIVGEASKRCLQVANRSCAAGMGLEIFDCDASEVSNNQKFNVVSDGTGNYTVSPVHSDLCMEVS